MLALLLPANNVGIPAVMRRVSASTAAGAEARSAAGAVGEVLVPAPSPREEVLSLLAELREGRVDRARLGADFRAFLTEARARELSAALRAAGEVVHVEQGGLAERGGMEVSTVRLRFANDVLPSPPPPPQDSAPGAAAGPAAAAAPVPAAAAGAAAGKALTTNALMYRSPDGLVQQLVLFRA